MVKTDNKTQKLLSMLGFAQRAGKLITGSDPVIDAIRKQPIKPADHTTQGGIVLLAADASENTTKRITNACTYHRVALCTLPIGMDELSRRIGKISPCVVCAVFDKRFSQAIHDILARNAENDRAITMEERNAEDAPSQRGIDL